MTGPEIKLYGYRWVVLGAFMFINLTIQVLCFCFAPITGPAAAHYGVSDLQIGFLMMVFMVVYLPLSLPASWAIDRFGFKKAVGLGAALLGIFGLARGLVPDQYNLILACTVGLALAQPFLLNSFTTLGAKWFPLEARATVAGLAMASNFIGTAIGLILTPILVNRYGLGSTQLAYGILTAISSAFFLIAAREAPPTPPGPAGPAERALMLDGLRQVLGNRDFWLAMAIFFVGVGVFNGIATWIEDIVRPKGMNPEQAGMLGGVLVIGGIFGAFVIPIVSDHFRVRKPFMLLGMACAIPGLLGFTFASSYAGLMVSIAALGFFMMGLAPVGYQYGAELTYPVPEGTSNGLLVLAGQVSVVFIFGMAAIDQWLGSYRPALLLGAALMAGNCLLIALMKEPGLGGKAAAPEVRKPTGP